jgi:hypothetical protein
VDGERNLHGGEKGFVFTVKVVMDESHIDPCVRCNAARGNAAESAFYKGILRCSENLSTSVRLPGRRPRRTRR